MRPLWSLIILLSFSSVVTWADQIYSVTMSAEFDANRPCISDCIETITANFQYQIGQNVIPGTFSFSASGFMESLSSTGVAGAYYIPIFNAAGDDIDILLNLDSPGFTPVFGIYSCVTQQCLSKIDFSGPWYQPAYQSTTQTLVPEPSTLALLAIPLVAYPVMRYRKRI